MDNKTNIKVTNSPINVSLAVFPGIPVRAVASVVSDVVVASGAVIARRTIAHVDAKLAVGARVPDNKTFIRNLVRIIIDGLDSDSTLKYHNDHDHLKSKLKVEQIMCRC